MSQHGQCILTHRCAGGLTVSQWRPAAFSKEDSAPLLLCRQNTELAQREQSFTLYINEVESAVRVLEQLLRLILLWIPLAVFLFDELVGPYLCEIMQISRNDYVIPGHEVL